MQNRCVMRRAARLAAATMLAALAGGFTARGTDAAGPDGAESKSPASGYLWGALLRATDQPLKEGARSPGDVLAERLGEAVGFRHFQLLGEHTQPVSAEYETWVLPSEELYMKVDSKGPLKGGGLGLHLQLWRRQNVILKTDVVLNAGSPIFISGPKWGEDQLVFVVQLKEQAPE